ncbi:MAG TPA: hypothetical protein PLN21_02575 [Gemmatales bacterium]|nr:hypothetical protein [Gemmatales bacterium]
MSGEPPNAGIPKNAYVPPLVGGVLTVIYLILIWGKLPLVIALFLGLFLFVAGALVGRAAMLILYPVKNGRKKKSYFEKVVAVVVSVVAVLLILGMGSTFTSLFIGLPLDLRSVVRPDLVSRKGISSEPRPLTPIPFSEYATVKVVPGSNEEQQARQLQNIMFQWIKSGSVPPTQTNALGFVFVLQSFDDFYQAFNAQLTFDKDATQEPLAARLVDGFALLESTTEKGEVTYRQVPWFVDRHNSLELDPLKAKKNGLFTIMPNKGDKLLVFAKLTSVKDNTQLIVGAADVACHLTIRP